LQCVAVCCSVLQCVAVCCSDVLSADTHTTASRLCLRRHSGCYGQTHTLAHLVGIHVRCSVLQCVAACCSVLQCVAVMPYVQTSQEYTHDAVCCSVLQRVAVSRSVLRCATVCCKCCSDTLCAAT